MCPNLLCLTCCCGGPWFVVRAPRKLLLLFPRVFFTNYPALQATMTVVVLLGALCIQMHYRPYRSDALNWLEFTALLIACWVLLAGLLFNAGEFPNPAVSVGQPGLKSGRWSVCSCCLFALLTLCRAFLFFSFVCSTPQMETAVAKAVIVLIILSLVYMGFALLWAAVTELSRYYRNMDDVNLPRRSRSPANSRPNSRPPTAERPPVTAEAVPITVAGSDEVVYVDPRDAVPAREPMPLALTSVDADDMHELEAKTVELPPRADADSTLPVQNTDAFASSAARHSP